MTATVHVLAIAGSLRAGSHNAGLLRAAAELLPAGMTLEIFDLAAIPLYNQDAEATPPEAVRQLAARIAAADALIIATPEYNYSIPGVLKNAIDWVSRPALGRPLAGKPLAIMGASGGGFGTVRAQAHLRQIATGLDMPTLNKPEIALARSGEKFDAAGRLVDADSRRQVRAQLEALDSWVRRLRPAETPGMPATDTLVAAAVH